MNFTDVEVFHQILDFGNDIFRRSESDGSVAESGSGAKGALKGTPPAGDHNTYGKATDNGAVRGAGIFPRINLFPIGERQLIEIFYHGRFDDDLSAVRF